VLAGGFSARTIIYLCGRVRFPAFEERLQAAGVRVRAIETYDTVALDYSDDAILARLSGQPVDAVLLYSANAAAAMQVLIGRPALHDLFQRACVFALSGRIAAALDNIASKKVRSENFRVT
jgi:uroporphyrinogen-III synthase